MPPVAADMAEHAVIYEQAGDGSWSVCAVDLPVYYRGTREVAEESLREEICCCRF